MIEATNLTKDYSGKRAVNDISFAVRPGVVTGFLGPNGSGKSTTMRLILGLDAPTAGDVRDPGPVARQHFGVEKRLQLLPPLLRLRGNLEIHAASRFWTAPKRISTHIANSFRYIDKY